MYSGSLEKIITSDAEPLILLEGRRNVPENEAAALTELARRLARKWPTARFRTGNAPGSDTLFDEGVAQVDPSRLEYVVPYAGHRKKNRLAGASVFSLEILSHDHDTEIVRQTIAASPKNRGVIENRHKVPALGKKAIYLLRDTLKVMGYLPLLKPATAAIFYADPDDPMKGGTGHTIRVCIEQGVPYALQDEWLEFVGNPSMR